jgi:hypothetical protein
MSKKLTIAEQVLGKPTKLEKDAQKARDRNTPVKTLEKLDYANKTVKEALIHNRSTPDSLLAKIDYHDVYKDSIYYLCRNRILNGDIVKAMLQHPDKKIKTRLCTHKKANLEDIIQTVENFPQLEEYPYRGMLFRHLINLEPEKFVQYAKIRFNIDVTDMPKNLIKEMFRI